MRVYKHTTCFGRFAGKVEAWITISEKTGRWRKVLLSWSLPPLLVNATWFRDLLLLICLKCDCLRCTTAAWRRCLSFYDEAEEMERVHLFLSACENGNRPYLVLKQGIWADARGGFSAGLCVSPCWNAWPCSGMNRSWSWFDSCKEKADAESLKSDAWGLVTHLKEATSVCDRHNEATFC